MPDDAMKFMDTVDEEVGTCAYRMLESEGLNHHLNHPNKWGGSK